MKTQCTTIVAIMFLSTLAGCTSITAETVKLDTAAHAAKTEASLEGLIGGYKQWTRVNPEPEFVPDRLAIQCAAVVPNQLEMEKANPHKDKFITVYVNRFGTKAMMNDKKPVFPQGSVIVKEKLTNKDSASPELLTVMIKREPGFNPENGDWEYMAVDGAGKQVLSRGKLEKCQACHTIANYTDFVYRSYLPTGTYEKMK